MPDRLSLSLSFKPVPLTEGRDIGEHGRVAKIVVTIGAPVRGRSTQFYPDVRLDTEAGEMKRPNPTSVESLALLRGVKQTGAYQAMNAPKVATALINGSHDPKATRPVTQIANKPAESPPSTAVVMSATWTSWSTLARPLRTNRLLIQYWMRSNAPAKVEIDIRASCA